MKTVLFGLLLGVSFIVLVLSIFQLMREIAIAYKIYSFPGDSGLGGYATGMAILILVGLTILSRGGIYLGLMHFLNN